VRDTLKVLRELEDTLNRLDGREVHAGSGKSDNTRGDSAEQIAAALRRRKIVRER
jgi:hypothetical protein